MSMNALEKLRADFEWRARNSFEATERKTFRAAVRLVQAAIRREDAHAEKMIRLGTIARRRKGS